MENKRHKCHSNCFSGKQDRNIKQERTQILVQYKQIISLSSIMQFIPPYNLPMKVQNTSVKLECSQPISKLEGSNIGPFQISHGEVQIKPIFTPYPVEWSNLEIARYAAFILHHKNSFENRPHTKLWNLYKDMSNFIRSRNYRQCRNHHYRFRQSSMSITTIIQFFIANVQDFDTLLAIEKQNLNRFYSEKHSLNNNFPPTHKHQYPDNQPTKLTNRQLAYNPTAQEYNPQIMNFNQNQYKDLRFMSNPTQFMQQVSGKFKDKQWVECHNLFLQWTIKLKELKEMSFGR